MPAAEAFSVLCVPPQSEMTKPLKSPILLKNVVQDVGVLTSVVAVDAVIGAHHRAWVRNLNADMEGEKIGLLHRTFGDDRVHDVPTGFLIVEREMLHVANDVLRLLALHEIADHGSGEQRIFSGVLEGPAVPRFARKVYAPTQRHIEALRPQLSPDERAVLAGALRVPARSGRQTGWKRRRVAAIRSAVANAVGGVRNEIAGECPAASLLRRSLRRHWRYGSGASAIGRRAAMPLPCRSAIFSSRVICFRTSSARFSGERLEFIQGWFAFCAMTEPAAATKISIRASTSTARG